MNAGDGGVAEQSLAVQKRRGGDGEVDGELE